MAIEIKRLTVQLEAQYNLFLEDSSMAMFYHSLQYRNFLRSILDDVDDCYFCAFHNDELIAILPLFIKKGVYGSVINSLPFYGSHGGIVFKEPLHDGVVDALLTALKQLCVEYGAIFCTLIEPLLSRDKEIYLKFKADFFDERIGQVTFLPDAVPSNNIDERLFQIFHPNRRWDVRKALKGDFKVTHGGSDEIIKALHEIHESNILGLGGLPKSFRVFEVIQQTFLYDQEYRIYVARKGGKIVCCLLVFYFKKTVEYFTPATLEDYRSDQPLSLLIYTAMLDAVTDRGARVWNWGGTWTSQRGVYDFKARWGAVDYPYRYHIKIITASFDKQLVSKTGLLNNYKYFYTLPFSIFEQ